MPNETIQSRMRITHFLRAAPRLRNTSFMQEQSAVAPIEAPPIHKETFMKSMLRFTAVAIVLSLSGAAYAAGAAAGTGSAGANGASGAGGSPSNSGSTSGNGANGPNGNSGSPNNAGSATNSNSGGATGGKDCMADASGKPMDSCKPNGG
jgi:hypothetical protein